MEDECVICPYAAEFCTYDCPYAVGSTNTDPNFECRCTCYSCDTEQQGNCAMDI